MKKLLLLLCPLFLLLGCTKDNNLNTDSLSTALKYPYFSIDQITYGGISSFDYSIVYPTGAEIYGSNFGPGPHPPCAGQTNLNGGNHKNKFYQIMIIDTTKSNTNARLILNSGSTSNAFKLKGTYSLPTSSIYDPKTFGHCDCPALNTCGQPNSRFFNHETGGFLHGAIIVNDDYYYIYTGNYIINSFEAPLNSTFTGKAYKKNVGYNVSSGDNPKEIFSRNSFDTTKTYNITAKFN